MLSLKTKQPANIMSKSSGGLAAGSLAQLIASPTDLVKVQMQAEGRRVLQGRKPRFTTCRQAYTMLYKESGIKGFWRGTIIISIGHRPPLECPQEGLEPPLSCDTNPVPRPRCAQPGDKKYRSIHTFCINSFNHSIICAVAGPYDK